MGNSNTDNINKESNSNQIRTWKFVAEDNLLCEDSYFLDIDLQKTLISNFNLTIKYCKSNKDKFNVPISASSDYLGFISGINWKPKSIIVNKTEEINKFEYFVNGVVEWKLLEAKIYAQPKKYNGFVFTK